MLGHREERRVQLGSWMTSLPDGRVYVEVYVAKSGLAAVGGL